MSNDSTVTMENNIQKDSNNETNSSLYIYYDIPGGRLGNRLFGFASAYGIAQISKRQLVFNSHLKMLNYLLPNLDLNKTAPVTWDQWMRIDEVHGRYYDEKFIHLPQTNVTIGGYLQSFKYFQHVSEEIFQIYSNINPQLLEKVESFKDSAKEDVRKELSFNRPTTVCIHVRRGDFIKNKGMVWAGCKIPTPADLHFAMNWMERKFKEVIFYVASNGKNWCHKHLKKENVFISNFTCAEDDFTLMQSCDHMIMTVGTFGWWAAWMTSHRGGDVMYYRDPFTAGSFKYGHFDRAKRFPGHWLTYGNNSVIQSKDVGQ